MLNEYSILLAIVGILQAANFWFLATVYSKINKLSNGCFVRHIELAKEEGKNEMILKALHERLDKVEP